MKKIFLLLALASFMMMSCNANKGDDSSDTNTSVKNQKSGAKTNQDGMYEYEEDVPVPLPGETDYNTAEVAQGKLPFVVDFSATWCGPCKKLKPYFKQMENVYAGEAIFRTIDIDEHPELANAHNVEGVPTVIIFSDSTMTHELYRVVGFDPQGLEEAILDYI